MTSTSPGQRTDVPSGLSDGAFVREQGNDRGVTSLVPAEIGHSDEMFDHAFDVGTRR